MKTTQHTPGKWTYEVWHYDTRGDRLVVQIGKDAIAELIPLYRPTIEQSKAETEANARFIATACNAHYELIDVLCSIINGSVRISDKANDMLSEHDPKVIRARAIVGQLLLDAMEADCDAAIQSAQGKE